ncbi:MAG: LysR family transcriptional regulator, partial [Thermoproteus sp.]
MDKFVVDVLLLREGKLVMNAETALLLKYIDETGSILSAAKKLGLSYSRAWSYIAKAERTLGVKLVEARKGYGGGAKLTQEGRAFLSRYMEFVERRLGGLEGLSGDLCDFVYAGSSDPFMEYLLNRLREE